MSFVVYWSEMKSDIEGNSSRVMSSKEFLLDDLKGALTFTQEVRKLPTASHISMASENPNMVGKQGVSDPSPDYKWMKRRTC